MPPPLCKRSHIDLLTIINSQKQPSVWSIGKRPANQFQTSSWLEKVEVMKSCFVVLQVSVTSHRRSMTSEPCTDGMIKSNTWSCKEVTEKKDEVEMAKRYFRVWLKCHINVC